jgi:hypothetical protein
MQLELFVQRMGFIYMQGSLLLRLTVLRVGV